MLSSFRDTAYSKLKEIKRGLKTKIFPNIQVRQNPIYVFISISKIVNRQITYEYTPIENFSSYIKNIITITDSILSLKEVKQKIVKKIVKKKLVEKIQDYLFFIIIEKYIPECNCIIRYGLNIFADNFHEILNRNIGNKRVCRNNSTFINCVNISDINSEKLGNFVYFIEKDTIDAIRKKSDEDTFDEVTEDFYREIYDLIFTDDIYKEEIMRLIPPPRRIGGKSKIVKRRKLKFYK